jgi:hypothetical protein
MAAPQHILPPTARGLCTPLSFSTVGSPAGACPRGCSQRLAATAAQHVLPRPNGGHASRARLLHHAGRPRQGVYPQLSPEVGRACGAASTALVAALRFLPASRYATTAAALAQGGRRWFLREGTLRGLAFILDVEGQWAREWVHRDTARVWVKKKRTLNHVP